MPLIEIINITLLAFSIGLLALMGISYLIYRFRETYQSPVKQNNKTIVQLLPKEIKSTEKTQTLQDKKPLEVFRYQIIKTYTQSIPFERRSSNTTEKFLVVNKNVPSLRKTHSPKFIYLVTSPSNR